MSGLCHSEDGTQGIMNARKALNQVLYTLQLKPWISDLHSRLSSARLPACDELTPSAVAWGLSVAKKTQVTREPKKFRLEQTP